VEVATYVSIPGGGGDPWEWHRLVPELERRGHEAIAVRLPSEDVAAGWSEYADAVGASIGHRGEVIVAESMGGFTAPIVCTLRRVDLLVLLNAMIPVPGETFNAWAAFADVRFADVEEPVYYGRDADAALDFRQPLLVSARCPTASRSELGRVRYRRPASDARGTQLGARGVVRSPVKLGSPSDLHATNSSDTSVPRRRSTMLRRAAIDLGTDEMVAGRLARHGAWELMLAKLESLLRSNGDNT
jgi:hypothetical protein